MLRRRDLRFRSVSRDPGIAPVAIPTELRGRRVMTRLLAMTTELRLTHVEPKGVHLTLDDEQRLFETAAHTLGAAGAEAARKSRDEWRVFLRTWFWTSMKLELTLDAEETRVL